MNRIHVHLSREPLRRPSLGGSAGGFTLIALLVVSASNTTNEIIVPMTPAIPATFFRLKYQ